MASQRYRRPAPGAELRAALALALSLAFWQAPAFSQPPSAWPAAVQLAAMNSGTGSDVGREAPKRPPEQVSSPTKARDIAAGRRSVGGVGNLLLDEHSVSARIAPGPSDVRRLHELVANARSQPFGAGAPGTAYRSVKLVLDNVRTTGAGAGGGYFYKLFLNLPENVRSGQPEENFLAGTLGPFEVAGAAQRGGTPSLSYPATRILMGASPEQLKEITVSFVRINGDNSPRGAVLSVGEARLELSADDIE